MPNNKQRLIWDWLIKIQMTNLVILSLEVSSLVQCWHQYLRFKRGDFYPFLEWQILRASLLILTACQTFPLTGPPKQVLNYLTLKVCGVQTELLFLFHPILVLPKKYLMTWAMQIQTKTLVLYPDVPCLLIQPSSNPPLYTFNTASKCFSCYFTLLYNVTSI